MREIKFRAWNKEWGMLLPVDKIFFEDGKPVSISVTIEASDYPHTNEWEDYEIGKDIELMQYTGLKDKNGKGIYEGDIVKWSDGDYKHPSNPRIAEVRFDPELCFFAFNVDGGHKFGFSNFIYTDTEKHIEIIGNIYENPELLNPHTT